MTRCCEETFSKPHPAMLTEIMDSLSVRPNKPLMIGDSSHDLQMAQNALVSGVGMTYGVHSKEDLLAYESLKCFDRFEDWVNWILSSKED